jgi:hypothetical protein
VFLLSCDCRYNTVCALSSLQSHSDAILCLHNADAAAVCKRRLNITHPSMKDINSLFATQVIAYTPIHRPPRLTQLFIYPGLPAAPPKLCALTCTVSCYSACGCCDHRLCLCRSFPSAQTIVFALHTLRSPRCTRFRKHALGLCCSQCVSNAAMQRLHGRWP